MIADISMRFGFVYWHPRIYQLAMRVGYGHGYNDRYKKVSEEIGELEVLDVCCGDAKIASYLPDTKKYHGIDFNSRFVEYARKRGLSVQFGNVRSQAIPAAECVLMQGSLYHFFPSHRDILRCLIQAATVKVIISEPVHNVSASKNALMRNIARIATKTAAGFHEKRFSKGELIALAKEFNANKVIDVGNDMILSFDVRERSTV